MAYWFDGLTEDELVANALLLGAEFMTPAHADIKYGYGPYYRFHEGRGWSIGYVDLGTCAHQYLCSLERQKTIAVARESRL